MLQCGGGFCPDLGAGLAMKAAAPASFSMPAEMSPVKAPDSSARQSCPPTLSCEPDARDAADSINVAGGKTHKPTVSFDPTPALSASISERLARRPFIFQFPATRSGYFLILNSSWRGRP